VISELKNSKTIKNLKMRIKTHNGLTPANSGIVNILDELFNSSFSDIVKTDFVSTKPSVNIIEEDDKFKIELAAPGLAKADFNIEVDKDQLIISATLVDEKTENTDDKTFSKREFNYSSFKRSFHLSDKVDSDSIDAIYKNGILTVNIKKSEKAIEKEPTVIDIK